MADRLWAGPTKNCPMRRRPRRWPGGPVLIKIEGGGGVIRGGGAGEGRAPGECLWREGGG